MKKNKENFDNHSTFQSKLINENNEIDFIKTNKIKSKKMII